MSDASVSVVIANWNGQHFLERCLTSLLAQTHPPSEIIVVDNGSTDGSVEWIRAHFPTVRLVLNDHNRGFAAANNQGWQASHGAYIALINNDAWAAPEWLAVLVAALEADERVGMVASKMLYANQPRRINSTGICIDRWGVIWDRQVGETESTNDVVEDVFGACAGAALYRRRLLEELGGFDEFFFAYLEDVDLAWRARWLGWRAVYAPRARVYHHHSSTGIEGSPWKTRQLARNKTWLLIKNYPSPYWVMALPGIVLYEVLSLGFALVRGRGLSAALGRWEAWRAGLRVWRQRQTLLHQARVSPQTVWAALAPGSWAGQVYARYHTIEQRQL